MVVIRGVSCFFVVMVTCVFVMIFLLCVVIAATRWIRVYDLFLWRPQHGHLATSTPLDLLLLKTLEVTTTHLNKLQSAHSLIPHLIVLLIAQNLYRQPRRPQILLHSVLVCLAKSLQHNTIWVLAFKRLRRFKVDLFADKLVNFNLLQLSSLNLSEFRLLRSQLSPQAKRILVGLNDQLLRLL